MASDNLAAALAPDMSLPDSETLELSDTLNTILAGIEYHKPPILQRLARTMLPLSNAPKSSIENLSEEQLRERLKSMALGMFKNTPQDLKVVDQALSKIELEIIREHRP